MKLKFFIALICTILTLLVSPVFVRFSSLTRKDLNSHLAYGALSYLVLRYLIGNPFVNGVSLLNSEQISLIALILVETIVGVLTNIILKKKNWNVAPFALGYALCAVFVNVTVPLLQNTVLVYQVWQSAEATGIETVLGFSNLVYLSEVFVAELILVLYTHMFDHKVIPFTLIGGTALRLTGVFNGLLVIVVTVLFNVALRNRK